MWPQDVSPQSLLPEDPLYHMAFPIQVTPVLPGGIEGAGNLLEGRQGAAESPKPARLCQSSYSGGFTRQHYQLQPAMCEAVPS